MALDWFREWGFSWYQPWSTASCTHPSSPTGEPAQVAPGRALSIIPKPEMEAGAYLGGGGKKPDLGLEVRRCHRKHSSSGLSSTGWSIFSRQTRLEPGFPSQFPNVLPWCLRTSGWWQKSCFRNTGIQGRSKRGEAWFSHQKQTNPLCGLCALKGQVNWAVPWSSLSSWEGKEGWGRGCHSSCEIGSGGFVLKSNRQSLTRTRPWDSRWKKRNLGCLASTSSWCER